MQFYFILHVDFLIAFFRQTQANLSFSLEQSWKIGLGKIVVGIRSFLANSNDRMGIYSVKAAVITKIALCYNNLVTKAS